MDSWKWNLESSVTVFKGCFHERKTIAAFIDPPPTLHLYSGLWEWSILLSPSLGSQWSESGVCTSFLWLHFWVSMPSLSREGVGFHRGSQTKGRKAASIVWNDFFLGREWGSSVGDSTQALREAQSSWGPWLSIPCVGWSAGQRPTVQLASGAELWIDFQLLDKSLGEENARGSASRLAGHGNPAVSKNGTC